jgi:hypothetical protein
VFGGRSGRLEHGLGFAEDGLAEGFGCEDVDFGAAAQDLAEDSGGFGDVQGWRAVEAATGGKGARNARSKERFADVPYR